MFLCYYRLSFPSYSRMACLIKLPCLVDRVCRNDTVLRSAKHSPLRCAATVSASEQPGHDDTREHNFKMSLLWLAAVKQYQVLHVRDGSERLLTMAKLERNMLH
jgi:hypothetical protein